MHSLVITSLVNVSYYQSASQRRLACELPVPVPVPVITGTGTGDIKVYYPLGDTLRTAGLACNLVTQHSN